MDVTDLTSVMDFVSSGFWNNQSCFGFQITILALVMWLLIIPLPLINQKWCRAFPSCSFTKPMNFVTQSSILVFVNWSRERDIPTVTVFKVYVRSVMGFSPYYGWWHTMWITVWPWHILCTKCINNCYVALWRIVQQWVAT